MRGDLYPNEQLSVFNARAGNYPTQPCGRHLHHRVGWHLPHLQRSICSRGMRSRGTGSLSGNNELAHLYRAAGN